MLSERGGYEICSLCHWEDDGQDDPHADEVWGGPNGRYSLTQARENFKRHWTQYKADDHGAIQTERELEAIQAIVDAFDAMSEADVEERERLWQIVHAGEKTLKRELRRRIRVWEVAVKQRSEV